jgi:hypothetical protein
MGTVEVEDGDNEDVEEKLLELGVEEEAQAVATVAGMLEELYGDVLATSIHLCLKRFVSVCCNMISSLRMSP